MKLKTYVAARGAIAVILAATVASAILRDNYVVPAILIAAAVLALLVMRRQVTEVVYDERDWATAGRAAAFAIQIYSIIAVVLMLVLYASRGRNPAYETIAITLAYSTTLLMLLYASLFKYYSRIKLSKNRIILSVVIALAAAAAAVIVTRL